MRLDYTLAVVVLVILGVNAFAFEPGLSPSVEKIVNWSDLHARAGLALAGHEASGKQCLLYISDREADGSKNILVNVIEGKNLQFKADGSEFKFKPTGEVNMLAALRLQYAKNGRLQPGADVSRGLSDSKASTDTLMVRSQEDSFLNDKPYHFDNEVQITLDGKGSPVKAVAIDHTANRTTTCNLQ